MGFSLYNLFKATLLIINAFTILHPKRFLAKYGMDNSNPGFGEMTMKNQIAGFITATSYLKVPLIVVNLLIALVEVLAGG